METLADLPFIFSMNISTMLKQKLNYSDSVISGCQMQGSGLQVRGEEMQLNITGGKTARYKLPFKYLESERFITFTIYY